MGFFVSFALLERTGRQHNKTTEIYTHVSMKSLWKIRSHWTISIWKEVILIKFECGRAWFDLRPDVKYLHLSTTTLPNLGAKLHLGAIRNELLVHCGQDKVMH